jgi:hypothetical protein
LACEETQVLRVQRSELYDGLFYIFTKTDKIVSLTRCYLGGNGPELKVFSEGPVPLTCKSIAHLDKFEDITSDDNLEINEFITSPE